MASHSLHKAHVRKTLAPRREPYWAAPLGPGRFLGFRKIDLERASWVARARTDQGSQRYRALGLQTETMDYDAACRAAREWFKTLDAGVIDLRNYTVEDASKGSGWRNSGSH
jgi:hypothetical protein